VFNSIAGDWKYDTSFSSGEFTIEYEESYGGYYVSGGSFNYDGVEYTINTIPEYNTASIVCPSQCSEVSLSVIEVDEQTSTVVSLKALIKFDNLELSPDFSKIQADSATFVDMVGFHGYKENIVFKRK
jgi:hypothetical protein